MTIPSTKEATYESESSDADSASAFESPLSPVSDDVEVPKVTSKGKRVIRATAGKAASRNTVCTVPDATDYSRSLDFS